MERLNGRNVALLVLCLCAGYALVFAEGEKEIPVTKFGQNIAPTMTFLYWCVICGAINIIDNNDRCVSHH